MTETDITCSSWYDGSLKLWQPRDGFRATTDAVLVSAAVAADCRRVAELGAGAGAASLALARRCPEMQITAVERDPLMAGLLSRNITENALEATITMMQADIKTDPAMARLGGRFDHLFCNPPYNDESSSLSGHKRRRDAMAGDDLDAWISTASRLLAPRGGLTLISRADRLPVILESLAAHHLGEAVMRPVHSSPDQPAIRVLVAARKGLRGGLVMLPPLIINSLANNNRGTDLTAEMRMISQERAAITMKPPGRHYRPANIPR